MARQVLENVVVKNKNGLHRQARLERVIQACIVSQTQVAAKPEEVNGGHV
jgi:hypothetical protein